MMKDFAATRFATLQEELALWTDMGVSPAKRLNGIVAAVRIALADLKTHLAEHPFEDLESEISFFKYDKPRFFAEQLYAVERYTIDSNRPRENALLVKLYYEQELRFIKRFFDQHRYLHQYYLLDGSELDELYFVRGAQPPVMLLADAPEPDPEFSTAVDFLFARFMAYERLQEYLMGLLYPAASSPLPEQRRIKWPGDKTELIELGYGIYCWLRAHKSAVTIAEVIEWLELSFGITLPRHYRRFAEIKMRKVSSRTKFWDEAQELLVQYMDEGDVWKGTAGS